MSDIEIRPLTHSDRAAVAFALRHLGERSLYQRYLVSYGPPIRREVARLLSVDHWHHEVLLAFHAHPRIPIGVGEYVRADTFDVAEIAIAIGDDWQHQGVGRALMRELRLRALAAGIRRFSATTLYENHAALALIRELGGPGVHAVHAGGGTTELSAPLTAPPRYTATTSTATFSSSVLPSV
jgi:GNAT superfamily N-acetyltransferase